MAERASEMKSRLFEVIIKQPCRASHVSLNYFSYDIFNIMAKLLDTHFSLSVTGSHGAP